MTTHMDPHSPLYRIQLAERIELAFDALYAHTETLEALKRSAQAHEATARVDNHADWEAAKNEAVRRTLLDLWLSDNQEYHDDLAAIAEREDEVREVKIEIDKLRLLASFARG